jgi:hypothetical protein
VGVGAEALGLGEGVLTDGFTANFDHTNLPFEFFLQTIGFSPSQLLEFILEHADPVLAAWAGRLLPSNRAKVERATIDFFMLEIYIFSDFNSGDKTCSQT